MFPIQIAGASIDGGQADNGDPPPDAICQCQKGEVEQIGVGIGFWEPARIAEVVRTPMCFPTLGGEIIGKSRAPAGTHEGHTNENKNTFYHVHWIQYPVLNWLGMAITEGACAVSETMDVAYLSEVDPWWDDDEATFILNPEVVLFANPIAQVVCVADTIKAALTKFGFDFLFWCSGSQGSVYPISGSNANHVGGIDSTLAITHKMIFKLHREMIAGDTSTSAAMCGAVPQPILRKNQYKQQMLYPVPQSNTCYGLGVPSMFWGTAREFPYKGEDFSYVIWRKRTCCAF